MDSRDLSIEQVKRLHDLVGRQLRFLNRLCERMDQLQFPPDDPLYRAALTARHATQGLFVESHYASCTSGVGQPARAPHC